MATIIERPLLYLEEIIIGRPPGNESSLFTIYVDTERPIATTEGAVILFTHPSLSALAISLDFDQEYISGAAIPTSVDACFNLSLALDRVTNENYDPDGTILNALNFLLDFLRVTPVEFHPGIGAELYPFADHLTFDKEFGEYLAVVPGRRERILEVNYWSIGTITAHSTVLRITDNCNN